MGEIVNGDTTEDEAGVLDEDEPSESGSELCFDASDVAVVDYEFR